MKKEKPEEKKKRSSQIISLLKSEFPDVRISLSFANPLELLVATILSAQCTDERVNQVTAVLFRKYRKAADYALADMEALQEDIRPTGFYKNKAKSIQGCCRIIVEEYGGRMPDRMEDLVKLPGVGRKTANVILGNAYGTPGIVVDTHVGRLSRRLGLAAEKDPMKIEFELMPIIPEEEWTVFSLLLIHHGRRWCRSRKPLCPDCPLGGVCPSREEYISQGLAGS